jgi:hypothetical protein
MNGKRFEPDCVCNYCMKRKKGVCGVMSNKVLQCGMFSYLGEKSEIAVSLNGAKRLDSLINKDKERWKV